MKRLISIDPGSKKCGLVVADIDQDIILEAVIVKKSFVFDLVNNWIKKYSASLILLGDGTTSKSWEIILADLAPIEIVNEENTTYIAREIYWELFPPSLLLRLLPKGLLVPPVELDSLSALILIESYINRKLKWTKKPSFKILP